MATKKQKREAAEAKRAEFIAEEKARGLEAQRADRNNQEIERQKIVVQAGMVNAHYQDILDNATPEDWENLRNSLR